MRMPDYGSLLGKRAAVAPIGPRRRLRAHCSIAALCGWNREIQKTGMVMIDV